MKGSFTGAYRDKLGKLQAAHRGTIFLDEVGEMSLRMQAMLLRFLENGEIQAVGSDSASDDRRCAGHRGDQSQSSGSHRGGTVPRGPALPSASDSPRSAAAAVTQGRDPGARESLHRANPSAGQLHRRKRWRCSVDIAGQATCASCRTSSSRRCGCRVATSSTSRSCLRFFESRRSRFARRASDGCRSPTSCTPALVNGGYSFWDHIYPLFLSRDITRHDMRELVRKGLSTTRGNYRALLKLFGMSNQDYKRFLNFLAAHDCGADFRAFRHGTAEAERPPRLILPPLPAKATLPTESKPLASAG